MRLALALLIISLSVSIVSPALAEPAPVWIPPQSQINPGQQVFVADCWMGFGPMYYWMIYGQWPRHWSDVVRAGLVTQPLYGMRGDVIDPDDGTWDFIDDVQYIYQGDTPPVFAGPKFPEIYDGRERQRHIWPVKEGEDLRWVLACREIDFPALRDVKLSYYAPALKENDFTLDAESAAWLDGHWVFYSASLHRGAVGDQQLQTAAEMVLPEFAVVPDDLTLATRADNERVARPSNRSSNTFDEMFSIKDRDGQPLNPKLINNPARQLQLAVCSMIREGATFYYEAYGKLPDTYADVVAAGLSPLAEGTVNPLTGKPYAGLGEPNDFSFACNFDDPSKHVFKGMHGETLPPPAGPLLSISVFALDENGERFYFGSL